MKNILVPTDFSECANHATEMAILMAKRITVEIHFLHLLSVPIDWISLSDNKNRRYPEIDKKVKDVHAKLDKLVDDAAKAGAIAKKFVEFSDDYEVILRHAKDHMMDYIVMGSHGAKGAKEFFMGTNAQRVVRSAHIPVLVVKDKFEIDRVKTITFASDFDLEHLDSYRAVRLFAEQMGASIRLVFVNTPMGFVDSRTMSERMNVYFDVDPTIVIGRDIYNSNTIEEGIYSYCTEKNSDLLAMTTHGRKGLTKLFSGSLVESVINHLEIPTITKTLSH